MEDTKRYMSKQILIRIALAVVAVVLIGGAIVFTLVARSLPGDALYDLKVRWLEARQAPSEGDIAGQAHFALSRMGERLDELKSLAASGELTAENVDVATAQVGDYVNIFVAIVYDEVEHTIPPKDAVMMLSDLSVLIRAQQHVIATNVENEEVTSRIENLWREVTGMRLTQIGTYVYEAPAEEVVAFITEQITELSAAVNDGSLDEAEKSMVNYQLAQAAAALGRGNFADAIDAVLGAQEVLALNRHIEGVTTKLIEPEPGQQG